MLTKVTNARPEATNAKIRWIKRLGCGYRNRERFRNAICFHLGGLDFCWTPWPPIQNPQTANCCDEHTFLNLAGSGGYPGKRIPEPSVSGDCT